MISGFDGCGLLELRLGGHAAVRQRVRGPSCGSRGAAVPTPAALREPGRQRPRQRVDRPAAALHLLARRVHEVDVFGQRLAQRARHRLDAAVGDEPAADLLLDQLPQLLEPGLELLAREPVGELALARPRPARAPASISRCREAVEVELPQRAVEVVGAADGPARLHARELLHRRRREPAQLRRGPCVMQRVEEHLGELLAATSACRRRRPAPGRPAARPLRRRPTARRRPRRRPRG